MWDGHIFSRMKANYKTKITTIQGCISSWTGNPPSTQRHQKYPLQLWKWPKKYNTLLQYHATWQPQAKTSQSLLHSAWKELHHGCHEWQELRASSHWARQVHQKSTQWAPHEQSNLLQVDSTQSSNQTHKVKVTNRLLYHKASQWTWRGILDLSTSCKKKYSSKKVWQVSSYHESTQATVYHKASS